MSKWKVEAGNCACTQPKQKELPIDFAPTHEPGLCTRCFIEDNPNYQTIKDRLSALENEEKELLCRNFLGAHLERRQAQTTRYQMVRRSRWNKVLTLEIYRFSWGNNPDPEKLRRLLYDDIPNANLALMRNYKDGEDIQIRPILICENEPSRKNSAWRNIIDAASKWPVNSTDVLVLIFPKIISNIVEKRENKHR
jgi:hypothetical protein